MNANEFVQLCQGFINDLDTTCTIIAQELSRQEDPSDHLAAILEVATCSVITNDALDQLLTEYLPHFVQIVLARPFVIDCVPQVNEFLRFALGCAIQRLRDGDPALIPTIHRIFDPNRQFYKSQVSRQPDELWKGTYASSSSTQIAHDVVQHINYWGELGGFRVLLSNIDVSLPTDLDENNDSSKDLVSVAEAFSLDALICALKALCMAIDQLNDSFASQFLGELGSALCQYIRHLPQDQIQYATRDTFYEVLQVFEHLATRIENLPVERSNVVIVNLLRLEMAAYSFSGKSLEKRINGLTDLNDALKQLSLASNTSTWSPLCVIEWLESNKILHELLGETMHPELIKRGGPILEYYARSRALLPLHLSMLWTICTDTRRHEAIIVAACELFLEVVAYAQDPLLVDHVFELLTSLSQLEVHAFETLKVLATSGHLSRVVSWLWAKIKTDECVSQGLEGALSFLDDVVVRERALLSELLIDCVGTLQNRHIASTGAVNVSLQFMSRLSRLISEGHRIELLPEHQATIDVSFLGNLVEELREYKERPIDISNHVDEVKCRLLALHGCWILVSHGTSQQTLSCEHLSLLWTTSITNAYSIEESNLFFQWIRLCENLTSHSQESLMTLDLQKHLLEQFKKLEGRLVTGDAFECFQLLFDRVNIALGFLLPQSHTVVTLESLVGLNALWHLALHALDQAVSEEVISTLVNHHLSSTSKETFVDTCMKFLLGAKQDVENHKDVSASHVINRCIDLMRYFLEACQEPSIDIAAELTVLPSPMKHGGSVIFPSPTKAKRNRTINWPPPLSPTHGPDLRASDVSTILSEFQPAADSTESRTASLQRIVQQAKVHPLSTKEMEAALSSQPPPAPKHQAISIHESVVNNEQYFQTLFTLLDWPSETSERAWELLCDLPSNRHLLQHMVLLRDSVTATVSWTSLLDSSNLHRLLYGLRLVEALLLSPEEKESHRARRQWRERFLRLGGGLHLYETFIQWSKPSSLMSSFAHNLHSTCLTLLLNTLRYFVAFPQETSSTASPFDVTFLQQTLPAFLHNIALDRLAKCSMELIQTEVKSGSQETDSQVIAAAKLFYTVAIPENISEWTDEEINEWLLNTCVHHSSAATRENLSHQLVVFLKQHHSNHLRFTKLASLLVLEAKESSVELIRLVRGLVAVDITSPACREWVIVENLPLRYLQHTVKSIGMESLVDECFNLLLSFAKNSCFDGEHQVVVESIIDTFLLGVDGNMTSESKTQSSRVLAQELLFELATSPSTWHAIILPRLTSFHGQIASVLDSIGRPWNFNPKDEARDDHAFAGLVNPGCICYMNALLQQLYQLPSFRHAIFSLAVDGDTSFDAEEVAQLQNVFVSLQHTTRKWVDPSTFCLSHRDLDGQPTDLRVQMDADEFFGMLLDRVETVLKPQASSAQLGLGGHLVNQIITETGHISEREEPFVVLSLEVQNKPHVEASLASYVQGETLEGDNAYYCEQDKRKVRATKRVCVKTLPSTLVIHLKRFEFDFDTMEKMKLNDFVEFPTSLDMAPYTSDALSKDGPVDPVWYALKGIVIHSGTADMGHYYSFIQDRNDEQTWWEFNDQIVRPFSLDQLQEECFGGDEVVERWDSVTRTYVSSVQVKKRSAYMLLYDRMDSPAVPTPAVESSTVLACKQEIQIENELFHRLLYGLNDQHIELLVSMWHKAPVSEIALLKQTMEGILDLALLLPAAPSLASLISMNENSISKIEIIAIWFLQRACEESMVQETAPIVIGEYAHRRTWLFDVVFLCHDTAVKNLFWTIATIAVKHVATSQSTALVTFLEECIAIFYQREPIEVSGATNASALIANAALGTALQPIAQFFEAISTEPTIPSLLIETCHILHHFAASFAIEDCPEQYMQTTARISTFPAEQRFLTTLLSHERRVHVPSTDLDSIFTRMACLVSCGFEKLATDFVVFVSQDEPDVTRRVIKVLLDVLDEVKTTQLETMFDIFTKLLEISDGHEGMRAEALFSPESGLLEVAEYFKHHRTLHQYTYYLLEYCMTSESPQVLSYFNEIKEKVGWVRPWIWSYLRSDVSVGDLTQMKDGDENVQTVLELTEQFFGEENSNQGNDVSNALDKLVERSDGLNPAHVVDA